MLSPFRGLAHAVGRARELLIRQPGPAWAVLAGAGLTAQWDALEAQLADRASRREISRILT